MNEQNPSPVTRIGSTPNPSSFNKAIIDGLVPEVEGMYLYARENGLTVPPEIIARCALLFNDGKDKFTEEEIEELANIHQKLNKIIAPATPMAVVIIEDERRKHSVLSFLGAVPLVRNIMLTTILFLIMFIAVGQLNTVNEVNLVRGILENDGWNVVAIIAYLVSCAGLGACFAALFKLNGFISNATYDPRYDSTYWASILLGVISGLFISELLYGVLFGHGADDLAGGQNTIAANVDLGKPFLALIGGFSANMVYKIMQRLVDTVESLFKGDPSTQRQSQQKADQASLKQQQGEMQKDLAGSLLPVTELLDTDPDKAKQEIKKMVNQLLSK